jgi:hypothetical protein
MGGGRSTRHHRRGAADSASRGLVTRNPSWREHDNTSEGRAKRSPTVSTVLTPVRRPCGRAAVSRVAARGRAAPRGASTGVRGRRVHREDIADEQGGAAVRGRQRRRRRTPAIPPSPTTAPPSATVSPPPPRRPPSRRAHTTAPAPLAPRRPAPGGIVLRASGALPPAVRGTPRSRRRSARGPPSGSPRRTCRVPGPCRPRRSG